MADELFAIPHYQIEDLKVVPIEAPKTESEKKLDELLRGSSGGSSGVVNNLNSLVKKKKKVVEAVEEAVVEKEQEEEGKGKRKAEEPLVNDSGEKKVKVNEAA